MAAVACHTRVGGLWAAVDTTASPGSSPEQRLALALLDRYFETLRGIRLVHMAPRFDGVTGALSRSRRKRLANCAGLSGGMVWRSSTSASWGWEPRDAPSRRVPIATA